MESWTRYHRALRQRNAALRLTQDDRSLDVWGQELLTAGLQLDDMRRRYIQMLSAPLEAVGRQLLNLEVRIAYSPGWAQDDSFNGALEKSRDRDKRMGITHVGPHRADISVRVDGQLARERVSRGQQKLLASALILAQLEIQESYHPGRGALLIDDPAAELDGNRLAGLLQVVRNLQSQLFVTSLRPELDSLGTPGAVFHVEHGRVRTVV